MITFSFTSWSIQTYIEAKTRTWTPTWSHIGLEHLRFWCWWRHWCLGLKSWSERWSDGLMGWCFSDLSDWLCKNICEGWRPKIIQLIRHKMETISISPNGSTLRFGSRWGNSYSSKQLLGTETSRDPGSKRFQVFVFCSDVTLVFPEFQGCEKFSCTELLEAWMILSDGFKPQTTDHFGLFQKP